MVGRTIGKYRIVEQIGRGGMGTVYRAVDESLGRDVAIKVLNADVIEPEAIERFRREALTLARLNHPRIGAIHELTRDGHDLLMVMEFLVGDTCEKVIEKSPNLPLPQAVRICTQVLDALIYAHKAGVVHRDLKPANVIITPSGDVKVMDFGIARVQGSEHLTTHGFMVGTPAYMAPEQVRGEEVDPRMDLYSMAVVLYRLLTRRLPFSGDTAVAMIHSQLNNPPTPPRSVREDLPEWLEQVLMRGLAKAPADRFQSALEFKTALEQGMAGRFMPLANADLEETMGPTPTPREMRVPVSPSAVTAMPASRVEPIPPVAAAPSPAPPTGVQGTVTLRTPHLASAAIFVVLLIVGVGAIAYIAVRRSNQQVVTTAPAPAVTAPAAPATPAPPSNPPAAAAPQAASPSAANAPSAAASSAGAASRSTESPSARPTPSAPAAPPKTLPSQKTGDAAARSSVTAPAAVATTPATATVPAETFNKVRLLVIDGEKSREVDVTLTLDADHLEVREPASPTVIRSIPYRAIAAATYARARRPRGQNGDGLARVPDNIGGSGFLGGSRHWLTVQTAGEFLVLRLENENIIRVIMQLEAHSGTKVKRES